MSQKAIRTRLMHRVRFCLYARDLDRMDSLDARLILLIEMQSKRQWPTWTA